MTQTWTVLATLFSLLVLVADLWASLHAVLYKRDYRTALSWVGMIWLVPLLGSLLYLVLGVNRIERRAVRQVAPARKRRGSGRSPFAGNRHALTGAQHATHPLHELMTVVDQLTPQPLVGGNAVQLFASGDAVYADMLTAIANARHSIGICTYKFHSDAAGRQFVDALVAAQKRGVTVRVLADYVGSSDSPKDAIALCRAVGLPAAWFLPSLLPFGLTRFNLRNHRKLMMVDGCIGYTGGMNMSAQYLEQGESAAQVRDLHCRLDGPVVRHMQEAFVTDWYFAADELLDGDAWFPDCAAAGEVLARGIEHGPDEGFERLRFTLFGALAAARDSVSIVTPYFLPDQPLIHALNVAALRGVVVDIILPERSDVRIADWASQTLLWQLLERGVRIWRSPPPFDHAKLMLVDQQWTLLGSTNWDPRSLRLNFEFNVECYSATLGQEVARLIQTRRAAARQITQAEMDARRLPMRLRDGVARLFTPFL